MKKIIYFLVVVLMILLVPVTTVKAAAQTISQLEKELNEQQKKLNDTNIKKAINKQDIDSTNKKISTIKSDIEKINEDIDKKTKESEQLEKDIAEKNSQTKDLMRYYQVTSSGSSMMEYIMGAKSITDLVYRLSITEQISSYNKKVINQMNEMIKENEQIKKDLKAKQEELASLKSELDTQLIVLNQKQSELSHEGLSQEEAIKETKKQIEYYKKLGCNSNETISNCYSRIYSSKNNSSGGSSGGYLPSGTTFFRPTTSGKMSSGFGKRTLNGAANKHFAVDISMPIGTTVYAVAPGLVTKTLTSGSGGNQIVIQHYINGRYYTSYYCHLSVIGVRAGTYVTKDTIIGKSGNTGKSTGPHLHLGLAHGRWYVDYFSYYGSSNSFEANTFDPNNVITFPPIGSSYYNR